MAFGKIWAAGSETDAGRCRPSPQEHTCLTFDASARLPSYKATQGRHESKTSATVLSSAVDGPAASNPEANEVLQPLLGVRSTLSDLNWGPRSY